MLPLPAINARILCVEDDPEIALLLAEVLEDNGFSAVFVSSAEEMDADPSGGVLSEGASAAAPPCESGSPQLVHSATPGSLISRAAVVSDVRRPRDVRRNRSLGRDVPGPDPRARPGQAHCLHAAGPCGLAATPEAPLLLSFRHNRQAYAS